MIKRSTSAVFALWFLLLGLAPKAAGSATASTTFGVNITVQSACQVSATHATFRTYTAAVANATSSVSVTCTNPTPYNVSFIAGSAISTNIPTFKSIGAGPALPSLALQTGLQKIFNLKPTLNGNTAARTLTLQAANRSYAIDAASTYPGVVIVVVSY